MAVRITRPGKHSLVVETPVMNAAGTLGFGDEYRDLLDFDALGAFVTNPITYTPWSPATGTRVVPLDAGLLMHTGLPNPGVSKVVAAHLAVWERLSVPVIAHIVVNNVDELHKCLAVVDRTDVIAAVELGMPDDVTSAEIDWYSRAAARRVEKPVLVRLPFGASTDHAKAAMDGGVDAIVLCAAPRGTARDRAGRLVAGRIYGPLIKPLILRMVGQHARQLTGVPIIASGGIHSAQDARDYLEAGAVAVQVDSMTWVTPKLLETIARELGRDLAHRQETQPSANAFEEMFRSPPTT